MRNGTAYQLPPLVRLTDEIDCGLWRTPQARDGDPRGQQSPQKRMVGGHSISLAEQVKWPTPTARDWRSGKNINCWDNARPLSEMIGGSLNPTWVEWLMGFPLGWTDCDPSAMPSSRKSRK
jgi:DNA (cytosine-5)-methyltransferase 1